jgi:hypothetical protein
MSDARHALAEERSLALHHLVAERLPADPALLERARTRVARWLVDGAVARPAAEAWRVVLEGPIEQVIATLTDTAERARRLRRSSPFAGAIDPRTRWEVWRRVGAAARP